MFYTENTKKLHKPHLLGQSLFPSPNTIAAALGAAHLTEILNSKSLCTFAMRIQYQEVSRGRLRMRAWFENVCLVYEKGNIREILNSKSFGTFAM